MAMRHTLASPGVHTPSRVEPGLCYAYRGGSNARYCAPRNVDRMPPEHGATRYSDYGCRCEVCRAAHAERHRRLRAQRAASRPEESSTLEHGTRSTYLPRLPLRGVRRGSARGEPAAAQPGPAEAVTLRRTLGIRHYYASDAAPHAGPLDSRHENHD
jgi:hypothetical protein